MAGPDGKEGTAHSDDMLKLLVVVLVTAAAVGAWYVASGHIVRFAYAVRGIETRIVAASWFSERIAAYSKVMSDYAFGVADPWTVRWARFWPSMQTTGYPLLAVYLPLIGWCAWTVRKRMRGDRHKVHHNLGSLTKYQSISFPTTLTAVHFDPDDPNPTLARSAFPARWLIEIGAATGREDDLMIGTVAGTTATILDNVAREKVQKAFEEQLGPTWKGIQEMNGYQKLLLAVFALHRSLHEDKTKPIKNVALRLRHEAATLAAFTKDPRELDRKLAALAQPWLDDARIMDPALVVMDKHSYVSTGLMAVLDWCRTDIGVLASAEFLWLKRLDRTLWYCLNWVGRRVSMIESAGPVSHYFYECVRRRPIEEPRVDKGIEALEQYLMEQGFIEEPMPGPVDAGHA